MDDMIDFEKLYNKLLTPFAFSKIKNNLQIVCSVDVCTQYNFINEGIIAKLFVVALIMSVVSMMCLQKSFITEWNYYWNCKINGKIMKRFLLNVMKCKCKESQHMEDVNEVNVKHNYCGSNGASNSGISVSNSKKTYSDTDDNLDEINKIIRSVDCELIEIDNAAIFEQKLTENCINIKDISLPVGIFVLYIFTFFLT